MTETGNTDKSFQEALKKLYGSGSPFTIDSLSALYHNDAVFIDPVHQANGLQDMQHYFRHVYEKLLYCEFHFTRYQQQGDQIFIVWHMDFQHPSLKGGALLSVPGVSHLQTDNGKIRYHRDYYDLGCMLYDHIPVLGRITRWLKGRLSS